MYSLYAFTMVWPMSMRKFSYFIQREDEENIISSKSIKSVSVNVSEFVNSLIFNEYFFFVGC